MRNRSERKEDERALIGRRGRRGKRRKKRMCEKRIGEGRMRKKDK